MLCFLVADGIELPAFGEKGYTVHAGKKLVHECQFARAPSFARAIALIYSELHV